MTDKTDKGVKKNDNSKKNPQDVRATPLSSDSSTFCYEVPIPGAIHEPLKASTTGIGSQAFSMNAKPWGQDHIERSIFQLEQIVRSFT